NKTNFVVTDQAAPGMFIRQKNVSSKSAVIQVDAKLETKEKTIQEVELSLEIKDDQGKTVETQKYPVKISPQGVTYVNETIKMKSTHLWNGIRDPYLYSLTAKNTANGKELDDVKQPLVIRHIGMIANKR